MPLPAWQVERRFHEAGHVEAVRKGHDVVARARDGGHAVGNVDVDAEDAHVALEMRGAEIIHNLAIVDGRPFKVGCAQLVNGSGARCVLRQVQASVQARVVLV